MSTFCVTLAKPKHGQIFSVICYFKSLTYYFYSLPCRLYVFTFHFVELMMLIWAKWISLFW